jgi:hypothetical protein
MTPVTVHDGQTLLDISLQVVGDLTIVFKIAELNGLQITDDLLVGNSLIVPLPARNKLHLSEMFKGFERLQSGTNESSLTEGRSGIGFSSIEEDFIIQ